MSVTEYSEQQQHYLLSLARQGVCESLMMGNVQLPDVTSLPAFVQSPRACFVTLEQGGRLRGCIGSLEAVRPLAHDILHNACGAALHDYRFTPLTESEPISIALSVLSRLEPLAFDCEEALLDQLRPGQDGILLQAGRKRATFLPSVWQSLNTPTVFIQELKRKAGLPVGYWSPQIKAWRYSCEYCSELYDRPACA